MLRRLVHLLSMLILLYHHHYRNARGVQLGTHLYLNLIRTVQFVDCFYAHHLKYTGLTGTVAPFVSFNLNVSLGTSLSTRILTRLGCFKLNV